MKLRNLFLTAVAAVILAACGNQTSKQETTKETKPAEHVKVAVVGSAAHEIWDFVAEKAKKENIDLEVVEMNDYVLPNTALEEGSVQLNAFQHRAYLAQWNKDKGSDIKEIGTTFIVPLYYFSTKYKSLKDLPENAKVLVPKEVAIQGRALVALETEGLITLKDGVGTKASLADITSNPRNLEIIEAESAQAPRLLQDVDAASINGSMAQDAGLKVEDYIFTDADHLDTIPKDRFNIIAANAKDADNPTYKKIVSLFQADDVAKKMNEIGPGQYFPVWNAEK
ncbi:MetQ/NlpA family ABC transporter substrate-binding protein [uncultured Granulicatella sp.]|jgi:D-methionine ABC transporter periplasmic D-methionine-binding lipoprotein|uniref:MetQ/NlpA family ABC transporter substrate-binding protein n=1 Tax=uncultured Granulicatella sp. TaxID=316089 RepID=UPI0028D2A26D|nr:MetQ/NlpA family ABC transporter substrate-binding protein [uncultured Granulicatella sp.]